MQTEILRTRLALNGLICHFSRQLSAQQLIAGSKMAHPDGEKRQHPRFEIPLEGLVHAANTDAPFRVRNISAGGALIEVEANLRPGHLIRIEIPEIGMFNARMTRMNWKFAGICLEDGQEEVGAFISGWLKENPGATQAD